MEKKFTLKKRKLSSLFGIIYKLISDKILNYSRHCNIRRLASLTFHIYKMLDRTVHGDGV